MLFKSGIIVTSGTCNRSGKLSKLIYTRAQSDQLVFWRKRSLLQAELFRIEGLDEKKDKEA